MKWKAACYFKENVSLLRFQVRRIALIVTELPASHFRENKNYEIQCTCMLSIKFLLFALRIEDRWQNKGFFLFVFVLSLSNTSLHYRVREEKNIGQNFLHIWIFNEIISKFLFNNLSIFSLFLVHTVLEKSTQLLYHFLNFILTNSVKLWRIFFNR